MRFFKNVLSQLHTYVLWALLSAVFWGWIFTAFVFDAPAEKKVVIYVDAPVTMERELDLRLEEALPDGIRMIRVHPFSYAVFDETALLDADLYIVPASHAAQFAPSFVSWPEGDAEPAEGLRGMTVYDAAAGEGTAAKYILYEIPGETPENYYLFVSADTLHAASLTGTGDDAALEAGRTLLGIKEERK